VGVAVVANSHQTLVLEAVVLVDTGLFPHKN
jgi:hypothetical protein